MTTRKPVFDISGLSDTKKSTVNDTDNVAIVTSRGVFNDQLVEPIPNFNEAPCETVISGKNNAWIVFGRDRPADLKSGYGGEGHTQAGSLDIVVGRDCPSPKLVDEKGEKRVVNPDFFRDAARIHISQKTDVDKNFNLVDGNVGNIKAHSAIALKADGIRIIARDGGIKLVTRTDRFNSQGGEVKAIRGIELNAGNQPSGLQSMVKGENLASALKSMNENISKLTGIVDNVLTALIALDAALAAHTHICAAPGSPTTPSADLAPSVAKALSTYLSDGKIPLINQKINLVNWYWDYLSPTSKEYINSLYNKAN